MNSNIYIDVIIYKRMSSNIIKIDYKPKNVTQFLQGLIAEKLMSV